MGIEKKDCEGDHFMLRLTGKSKLGVPRYQCQECNIIVEAELYGDLKK